MAPQLNCLPNYTTDDINELVKRLVALGIETGEIRTASEMEAKLALEHLNWCRNGSFYRHKRNPSIDGTINRRVRKKLPQERWNEAYTKAVRLEMKLNGQVEWRETLHLRWNQTLQFIAEKCFERTTLLPEDLTMRVIVDRKLIVPDLSLQVGQLNLSVDRMMSYP